MSESSRSGGSAIGALFVVIGLLLLFSIFFNLFLVVPFFIFLGGIVAMLVSDSRRGRKESAADGPGQDS